MKKKKMIRSCWSEIEAKLFIEREMELDRAAGVVYYYYITRTPMFWEVWYE
jgi:hypothetical protein